MVRPKYPKDALRAGSDAVVELHAIVTAEGKTKELTGPTEANEFARAALKAVRKWRFHPVLVENNPVETTYKVHIHFNSVLQEAIMEFALESPSPRRSYLAKKAPNDESSEEHTYTVSDAGVTAPKAVHMVYPEYTEQARQEKESGIVTLTLVVGADSEPRNVKVACSSVPDLNERAIVALRQWKFEPGCKDGQPVAIRIAVDMTFSLYPD